MLAGLAQENLQVHPAREVVVTATAPEAAPAGAPEAHVLPEPHPAPKIAVRLADSDELLVEPTLTPPPLLADVEAAPPVAALAVKPARPPIKTVSLNSAPRIAAPTAAKVLRAVPAKAPPPVRPAPDPSIDSDVALLSAILIAAPRHSAERARSEAACNNDKKCQQAVLPSLLKTTD
jgi:hypothetical protein